LKLPVAKFDWVLTPAPETLLAPEKALALPAPLLTVAMAPVLVPLETLVTTDVLVFCAWATPALSPAIAAIAKIEMRIACSPAFVTAPRKYAAVSADAALKQKTRSPTRDQLRRDDPEFAEVKPWGRACVG
jgi:hypothetical protein